MAFTKQTHVLIAVAASLLLSACMQVAEPEPVSVSNVTPPAIIVHITDDACPYVEVESGFTIGWINVGKKEHILQSEPREDGTRLIETSILRPGDGWSMTFTEPGTISYTCSDDGLLRGTITVIDPSISTPPVTP